MLSPVIALWPVNVGRRLARLEDWTAMVDARLVAAAEAGAHVLVLPEYACAQWLSILPEKLAPTAELAWMAERAPALLDSLRPLVARHGVALVAGSMPFPCEGRPGFTNRAITLLPDGTEATQDKMTLTPDEQDEACWSLAKGDTVQVFEWQGLRWAVVICLDIEQPAVAIELGKLAPDVVLVPSMTTTLAGYHRVFDCAKARAVELFACVAAVGTIGDCSAFVHGADYNVSGAAAYVPCEVALGHTGVWGTPLPPRGDAADEGPLWISPPLPVPLLRDLKARGAAAVWQGIAAGGTVHGREITPQRPG